jgi:acyl transferase domain-containing protein
MKTAVVICPGRGTYNKNELGYLSRHFGDQDLLADFDARREALGQESLSQLDGAQSYFLAKHSRGDNASALIYAASLGDFGAIDREKIEVVAVTGNSMGWYSTLALGGALSPQAAFEVVNAMGSLMQESLIGGQLIYPFVGEDWAPDAAKKAELLSLVREIDGRDNHVLSLSIDLGGMLVLAGNEAGLSAFEAAVPPIQERFPLRLANHAAFHSALQEPVAEIARTRLSPDLFGQPELPLIDGRGTIWWPGASESEALWDYTFDHQVVKPYDFTHAIRIAAREFAPDLFIITGPGTTLGGAVAQALILSNWQGMASKSDFQKQQQSAPLLVSMGMDDQRAIVTKGD